MFSFGAAGGGAILFLTVTNREYPSLFNTRHPVVQNCFLHQSFLDMLPPLLLKGKTGRNVGRPL
jgi:hypothetical protein